MAVDLIGEAMFVLSEPSKQIDDSGAGSDGRGPAIIAKITDGSNRSSIEEELKGFEETKAKESKGTGSTSYPKSLASMRSEQIVTESEANPKGEPLYLPPYLIPD